MNISSLDVTHTTSSIVASSTSTMPSSGGAMAMALGGVDMTTFSFSTDVTLFFAGWRTDTAAKYFGTLVLAFVLTLFTRFLGAWRSQLGYKWANQAAIARAEHLQQRKRVRQNRMRNHADSFLAQNASLSNDNKDEFEPFSPSTTDSSDIGSPPVNADDEIFASKEEQILASLGPRWTRFLGSRWRAAQPWRFSLDAPRALLEGLRAFFGYLL